MLPDNKQIEEWGVIAVKNCLSMTDTLSQFIDENDKTPSWDGSVIIYRNNKRINSDIVGKVAVQVKGRLENKINQKECAFSVDMADLLNYKGNGGVIFFLVLINKQRFNQRKIYYETLTPLKIVSYISGHENQGSRTIKLKELAKDKHEIQTVFLNFYQDSTKQHSFAHIPPISIEDLTKRSDITKISANVEFFAPKKTHPSPIDIFLTHEVYWYAEIKGSPIPHPIEWNPDIIIASTKNLSVFVGDEEYENYVSVINARENTTVSFGKSTTLSIPKTKKGAKINYQLSNSLNDRLKDLAFLIQTIECNELRFGDGKIMKLGEMVADTEFDIELAKKDLDLYKCIAGFLTSISVVDDINLNELDNNSSLEELKLIMKSINGKGVIHYKEDRECSSYLYKKKIANLTILFILIEADKDKQLYNIYNFFDYDGIFKIIRGEDNHITSHYSLLKPEDYVELANIDFSKILSSFKDMVRFNSKIYCQANFDLLNLLLAYDKNSSKSVDILNAAKDIAMWILNESGDSVCYEIKILNYLQTIKRERELTLEENQILLTITEGADDNIMYRLAANLLLENYKAAQIQFSQMSDDDQDYFKTFPLFKFYK